MSPHSLGYGVAPSTPLDFFHWQLGIAVGSPLLLARKLDYVILTGDSISQHKANALVRNWINPFVFLSSARDVFKHFSLGHVFPQDFLSSPFP